MKKLLSLLLAVVLMFSMTACAGNEKEDEEAVKKVVDSFFGAVSDLELDKVKDYVVDEDEVPEEFSAFSVDKIMSEMPAEMKPYSEDFEKVFDVMMDKMKKEIAYEIKDVEKKEEDEYAVTVSFTFPDVEDIDVESLVEDKFNGEEFNAILLKLIEEGKITETSSEQEIMDLLIPELIKLLEDAIDDIEFEAETEEKEIIVVKSDDDKWLIDAKESGFGE